MRQWPVKLQGFFSQCQVQFEYFEQFFSMRLKSILWLFLANTNQRRRRHSSISRFQIFSLLFKVCHKGIFFHIEREKNEKKTTTECDSRAPVNDRPPALHFTALQERKKYKVVATLHRQGKVEFSLL